MPTKNINSPNVGVRNAMTGAGFDNYKIGYDSKNNAVTYDNKPVVSGGTNTDGTVTAPSNVVNRGMTDNITSRGYKPVRATLNKNGVNNDRIGYNENTKAVTVDGIDTIKPEYNIDGSTYDTTPNINSATKTAYDLKGDPVVRATDWAASNGLYNGVKWDGQNVTIGGKIVPTAYIQDGVAYVPKSAADEALNSAKSASGQVGNREVYDTNNKQYAKMYNDALNKLINRDSFEYSPRNDEVFQDHANYQTELANNAFRAALNRNNSGLNNASSVAMGEANAAMSALLRQLSEDEQSYRQYAADRYDADTERLRGNFADVGTRSNDDYQKLYQSNRDAVTDTNNARDVAYTREKDERQFERDERQYNEIDKPKAIEELNTSAANRDYTTARTRNLDVTTAGQQIQNDVSAYDYAQKRFNDLGYIPADQMMIYPEWKQAFETGRLIRADDGSTVNAATGKTLTPWDSELEYLFAKGFATARGDALGSGQYDQTLAQTNQINAQTQQTLAQTAAQAIQQAPSLTTLISQNPTLATSYTQNPELLTAAYNALVTSLQPQPAQQSSNAVPNMPTVPSLTANATAANTVNADVNADTNTGATAPVHNAPYVSPWERKIDNKE